VNPIISQILLRRGQRHDLLAARQGRVSISELEWCKRPGIDSRSQRWISTLHTIAFLVLVIRTVSSLRTVIIDRTHTGKSEQFGAIFPDFPHSIHRYEQLLGDIDILSIKSVCFLRRQGEVSQESTGQLGAEFGRCSAKREDETWACSLTGYRNIEMGELLTVVPVDLWLDLEDSEYRCLHCPTRLVSSYIVLASPQGSFSRLAISTEP